MTTLDLPGTAVLHGLAHVDDHNKIVTALGALNTGKAEVAHVARFAAKVASGANVKVTFLGDSGLEGTTADTPGTDDCASLVCSDLGSRFGVTVTKSNRASSGRSPYKELLTSVSATPVFTSALADAADLYVLSYGHNDIRSDLALPGNGYPLAAAMGALEHMVRRLRVEVPGADIVLSSAWPYTGGSVASNVALLPHGQAMRRLAAYYGCAFVDFYGALVEAGADGSTPAVDDIYTDATQHPTSAGHRFWADLIIGLVPAIPDATAPTPQLPPLPATGLYEPGRYGQWLTLPDLTGRTYSADGMRIVGTGWTTAGTLPKTSTTVGDYLEVQWIGSECAIRLDTGTGQGAVKVTVDAVDVHPSLNLSTYGTGQSWIPLTGLGVGVHRVVVTVLSGSCTLRGVDILQAPVQKIKHDAGVITYTGAGWVSSGTDATHYFQTAWQTPTIGESLTVEFVGTALAASLLKYTTTTGQVTVTVDGVAQPAVSFAGATANSMAAITLVSGLAYGRHTAVVALNSAGRVLKVSGLIAWDERRTDRPTRLAGVGKVADPITVSPGTLSGVPTVLAAAANAANLVPPYVTSRTALGFTVAGTAGAMVEWCAESGRSAW